MLSDRLLDSEYFFGVLHSRVHEVWTLNNCSWHGVGNDPTYNTSTCFDTFPFPWSPGQEPSTWKNTEIFKRSPIFGAELPKEEAIAEAAWELNEKRERWLTPSQPPPNSGNLGEVSPPGDGGGKNRTLTNLYNQRPTWLQLAHEKLDHAVLDAYGWPHDISDEEILEKLLALNLERAKGAD